MHEKHTPETVVAALEESGFNLGATLCYPQDQYGYVVIEASPSGKTLKVLRLEIVNLTTGHKPAYFEGPFPVWSHTYTDEERREMRREGTETLRWSSKRQRYTRNGTPFLVGAAVYHRNHSY